MTAPLYPAMASIMRYLNLDVSIRLFETRIFQVLFDIIVQGLLVALERK
jgi:hypothetical protein